MDKSRKTGRWESDRSSSPNLRAKHLNDSNDIGFDWLNVDSDLRATRTTNGNLVATRRNDLGATRRNDLDATRRDDSSVKRHDDLGATQSYDVGKTRRNVGATRRVDLGTTGDTRREDFGASAVDRFRATASSPYTETTDGDSRIPYTRELVSSGKYVSDMPLPYDYAVEDNKYAVSDGQDAGPRRWTSLAADKSLMEEWHTMFGQIRKKWTPVPSSKLEDDVTISSGKSSSNSRQRNWNKRAIILFSVLVSVALLGAIAAAIVVMLTNDQETAVQFNASCTGAKKEFCVTKHSKCVDSMCKCPVGRSHNSTIDSCTIIDCGDIVAIANGTLTSNGTKFGSVLNITCADGFNLSNETDIICTSPSSWLNLPRCDPVECVDFVKPNHSTINTNSSGRAYTDVIDIQCDLGYQLNTNITSVKCLANQSWSESPSCTIVTCSAFDKPNNGSITPDHQSFDFNTSITINCDLSYEIQGDSKVMCQANGSWSHIPKCVPIYCDPHKIEDATFEPNKMSYQYLDNVTVECHDGYKIQGNRYITCLENGSWPDLPTCVPMDCDTLEISNAEFEPNRQTYQYLDNVTVNCNDGYEIQGNEYVSCLANGSWTSIPACRPIVCSDFQLPIKAINNSRINDLTYDDSVYITCESGFVLVGNSNVSCNTNGSWPSLSCIEANCSAEDFMLPNNSRVSNTTGSGTIFEFECFEGYNLVGNSSVSCITGNWSEFPICEVISCGPYGFIENGNVTFLAGTNYNDKVDITCNENFKLIGDNTAICLQNGSWSEKPVCKQLKCKNFVTPENALIPDNMNETAVGTSIHLICMDGYDLDGAEKVVCQQNETWSEIPLCAVKDCGQPENIENGEVNGFNITTFNSTFSVSCLDGYDLQGNSIIQCQANGSWSNYPLCEIKSCGNITTVGNGTIYNETGTTFGSMAYVKCNDGFNLVGRENVSCLANGKWDTLPICKETDCGDYHPPDHATIGSTLEIICNEGYEISGDAKVECLNGNWSGNGTCHRVKCDNLPEIDNSDTAIENEITYYFGDKVNVTCKSGFELSNNLPAECDANKTWVNIPSCNRVSCGEFTFPTNSEKPSVKEGTFEDTINITCSNGFDLAGDSFVFCNATGNWENDPVCRPKHCNKFEIPEHSIVSNDTHLDDFTYNQSITVTCIEGYKISGKSIILCGANGEWDSSPSCLPVNCSMFMLPNNAILLDQNNDSFKYKDIVQIECLEGYMLNGAEELECLANGNWSDLPTCTPKDCGKHEPISSVYKVDVNGSTTFNSSLAIICEDGLELTHNSDKTVTCGSDGKWQGNPDCEIPGSVSFTQNPSDFMVDKNGTLRCAVSGNPKWQTVVLAKSTPLSGMNSPIYTISNTTGSLHFTKHDDNYTVSYNVQEDGVLISLEFLPVTCENEGVYTCAVIVGDIENATDTKFANSTVAVSCIDCGIYEPLNNKYIVDANGSTTVNSSLTVTCIDGLTFTDDSVKAVTCGSDGEWHGTPDCEIPGSLSFTESSYAVKNGSSLNITCIVSDYPNWQRLVLAKAYGGISDSFTQIFVLSNTSGVVENTKINDNYSVSFALSPIGASIILELDPVDCQNGGRYTCAAVVGDPENATETKFDVTQLNVSTDSVVPEINIPDRIYFGKEAKVECVGLIGKGSTGQKDGQLLLETNFGENGGKLTYNNTDSSEDIDCFFRESISVSVPTTTDAEYLWTQCLIQPKQGDALFSEKKNFTVSKSFVAFENSTYIFNVGEKSGLTCIVNGIPEWQRIEIKRSDGKVILGINSTDNIPDSYDSHVRLITNESSFSNDSATVAVTFDEVNCNDTLDGIGDVEYICAVETDNSTMEDKAIVTFQRKPQVPFLTLSREIIENKFTLGDRMFTCEGDVGIPPGSIEIQSNYNGTFETFLSLMPGQDNNTIGWIVNNETDISDCKHYKKLNFAFHNVTMDWQYKRLRCVIHPSVEILGNTEDLYDEKSINIIPADICVGKSGFIRHPYFCDLIVECSRSEDGIITGVPVGCEENMCYNEALSYCVECSSIGGCNITSVKCDRTSASVTMGDQLSFKCDIQDFGDVTYISVNDDVESSINDTDIEVALTVSNGVDVTVNEAYVILSFSNVSCDQEGNYIVNLNNNTDVTLSLSVISDPEEPFISVPDSIIANEATTINCSGRIGRDVDGNGIASLYLEVQFEDDSEYIVYDADATRQTDGKNCEISETVMFQLTPDIAWNNSVVRCTAKNDNSDDPVYSTREHIILDTPGLFCNPMLLGGQSGDTVTFSCDLKDVEKITSLSINKNETIFINESNVLTIPYEESEEDIPFTVSVPSLERLIVSFTNVECDQEGDYSVVVNNDLTAMLTLRVLSPTAIPNISVPSSSKVNQRLEIACSGEVGRDINGDVMADIYVEVKFEMESEFSMYNGSIEKGSVVLDKCVNTREARLIFFPDIGWNNSHVRCVSKNKTNIVESSESEKIIAFNPSVYFENTTLTGILGESVVLTCILKRMNNLADIYISKGEIREVIASHSNGSGINSVTILHTEIDGTGTSGTLEINMTLSCGDDGKYYCHQNSSDPPSEAVAVLTTEWKAKTPILDPSSDMVENSDPWAGYGFETTCTGEMGTLQDATMYLESNLDGIFTKIATATPPIKDLDECTNIATIIFNNKYTSAWNGTILRCVIETEDDKLVDAEYVQVVPDSYCDNITDNNIISHPFDCRGLFTCGGSRKITAQRPGDCDIDECYKPSANTSCVPCADVNQCRPDPLEGAHLEETHFRIITKANGEWWHFDGGNPVLKRVSSQNQTDDDFVKFTFEMQIDGTYKIKSVAQPVYMYDGYGVTNATTEDLFGADDNPDDEHMRFIFTKETEDYYRIQTKATLRYVRLDEDNHVSSNANIVDDRSLFEFQEVPNT